MGQARQFSGGTQTAFTPKRANAYLERSYYGGPEHECPYCGAVFLVPGASEEGFICHTTKNCVQSLLEERKIDLKPYEKPPSILANLLRFDGDVRSKRILKLIRSYNSLFVFTSFGAAIDKTINNGTAPYVFKINGVVHHRIGTLLPQRGLGIFKDDDGTAGKPENEITMALLNMLDDHNKLVIAFRYARDRLEQEGDQKITPKLLGCNTKHDVQYSLPSSGEIAAIIVGDYAAEEYTYDVPVHDKECGLRRISCLHPSYMALQYPLLFPYGEHGFHLGIRYSDADDSDERKRKYVTHLEFVRRHMHYRLNEANPYTCYGRLSDQIVVDSYSTIEGSRLQFIADHQKELRFESVQGIADAIDKGLISADSVGGRKIVPASFTGGQRYHMMNYQDAMAICKVYGPPDLFVTFTCNTKWREIVDALRFEPGQQPCDRSDLIVRVFHMKVDEFIADIREGRTFGPVLAVLYTVEFQKSGLPHIHCLVWLADGNKEFSASVVDDFICAEIPDVSTDPLGYALVDEFMMHGPCGDDNKKCPCMKDDKCSKNFPKAFQNETNVDDFGFTIYRRRNDGRYVVKNGVPLDNRNVVPYNMHLLKKYNAHINVEWCNKSNMIKYLFKYVTKGSDRAKVYFEITAKTSNASPGPQLAPPNEIQEYINARYLSTCEALWRGFEYDIHFRVPPVERLVVHLPGLNHVRYEPGADLRALLASPAAKSTMLTEWFEANLRHEEARHLTYCEFPKEWTWDASDRCWRQRARGAKIGRMYYVHPAAGELYYLRMLLMMVKGCKNYADVRTFNTKVYSTFRDACEARGLLEGDNEWNLLFDEAVVSASAYQLRQLFVTVVLYCSVGNVRALFDRYWLYFIDDIRRRLTDALGNPNYSVPHEQLMSLLIQTLTSVFANSGGNIRDYDLPTLTTEHVVMGENRLINDELDPEPLMLSMHAASLVAQLNSDQRNVYDKITGCVLSGSSGFFFLSGHGGTGKTFLWNAIIASLRSEKKIVLAVASSGVASLLLPRGRTAHSRFKIPFDITEAGTCNVKRGTMLAELIQVASLIIWDKAPMTHRRCFEALDITMRDILSKCMSSNANLPFGGKPIVLGDFRQILPMGDLLIPQLSKGEWKETICVRASRFWDFYDPQDETKLLHSDLVFIDEEGNSIHAQIYPPLAQEIKPKIKEGSVYNLSCFVVKKSNRQYKPVSNDNMISLTSWTEIDEVVEIPPAFPVLAYSLTPIEQIHSHVDDKEYYTDAIGVITSISSVTSQRSKGQQTASLKRTISICNAGGASVNVVLWGGQATLFLVEQLCNDGQTSPQIVVFVGTLVKKYADGLCLSGGSPCKWYINPDIPEAKMLMARARSVHKPIKWNEILASSRPVVPAVEEQKVSYIKYLHPFENKRKEFLVIVTIKKIDKKWWYNSCRKCTHTAEHRGDTYKCINTDCNTVGASTQRYKLFLTAGDETGDTDFVLFGRIAQRLVKRLADILIAENLVGFMPDTITKLLERTFIWNVSFTKNTITSGNVNAVVGEIDTENDAIPMSQGGSHQSSLMVSQGASSSLQNTPEKGGKADTEDKSGTDPGENASVLGDSSTTKKQENTARKRSRSSPNKATAKMLFTDGDDGGHDDQGSAEDTSEPGYYPYPLIHFKQCLDVEKQMQRWYCTDHITLGSRSTWRKKITP
ncbi:hypothetical protein U9M48_035226 [Paspalum notatum var. saurae]|uniref:ATP-dependent DNA helicase n=1 Tax=Paspalum notatum var. saurae TaxID=547442 RepID=A0AAQ3UAV9_PASNO